jgi:hypothetical protein
MNENTCALAGVEHPAACELPNGFAHCRAPYTELRRERRLTGEFSPQRPLTCSDSGEQQLGSLIGK